MFNKVDIVDIKNRVGILLGIYSIFEFIFFTYIDTSVFPTFIYLIVSIFWFISIKISVNKARYLQLGLTVLIIVSKYLKIPTSADLLATYTILFNILLLYGFMQKRLYLKSFLVLLLLYIHLFYIFWFSKPMVHEWYIVLEKSISFILKTYLIWVLIKQQVLNIQNKFFIQQNSIRKAEKQAQNLEIDKDILLEVTENRIKDLEKLNEEFFLVEQRERNNLAVNLHDTIGQNLATSKLLLNMEEDTENKTKVLGIISDSIKNIKASIFDLSSIDLEKNGFILSINNLLNEYSSINNWSWDFNNQLEDLILIDSTEYILYRSLKELLHNINKYSGATKVTLTIEQKAKSLVFTLIDNGIGISKTRKDGLGLKSITDRMLHLEGSFTIEKTNPSGTKAILLIPIDSNRKN